MRKLFLTFLLVLLPLQFAQAAMCAYCCDEKTSSSTQAYPQDMAPDAEQHADAQDNDASHHSCGVCHLACAKYVISEPGFFQPFKTSVSFHQETIAYQSYIPRGLDRPNWTFAA